MNKQFIKDLDLFVNKTWEKFFDDIKQSKMLKNLINVELLVNVDDDFRNKYNIKEDIDNINFTLQNNSNGSKVKYYHNGLEIKPECYYIRPEGYQAVSILKILQEAVKQSTHTPNIKHLELPEARSQ